MKKLLTMTAALASMVTFSGHAFADNHGGEGQKGAKFAKHDTNGDGVISKSEFLAHAEERFAKMDADSSGDLSKDELKAARGEMRKRVKDKVQQRRDSAGE